MKPLIVTPLLKKGADNAIGSDKLKDYFRIDDRELKAQIERERRAGNQILSKKGTGGGYFLPASENDIKAYIAMRKRELATTLETLYCMKAKKTVNLPESVKSVIKGV